MGSGVCGSGEKIVYAWGRNAPELKLPNGKYPESFISLFSLEKLTRLFLAKEVKPFPDRKMIKLLTFGFDNFFPSLRR